MSNTFDAFRIHADQDNFHAGIETLALADLSAGDVVIKVQYSSVNYKDALAGTGKGKILRTSPLNGGIDLAGEVISSSDERFKPGQSVLANGSGLSEVHDGGYSQYARIPADWVVPMPAGLDVRSAMLMGTAGFTAALAIQRLQDNHQTPEQGPILVTGATGGVGSFAIMLLNQLGYQVIAMTRQQNQNDYLTSLGADTIVSNDVVQIDQAPLHKGQWAAAIDNLGGDTLAWLSKSVKPAGNIVSIGMAAGAQLTTSTMPFILRGISILGVTSAGCAQAIRKRAWQSLGAELMPQNLDQICGGEIGLTELTSTFEKVLSGNHRGRYLVKL